MNYNNTKLIKQNACMIRSKQISSSSSIGFMPYYLAAKLQKSSASIKNDEKTKAKVLIAQYANLKKNWNDNGADPISHDILMKSFELIDLLPIAPEVFPTACGTIQFEYEKENGEYLEFEMGEDMVDVLKIGANGKEVTEKVSYDKVDVLRKMVKSFHG